MRTHISDIPEIGSMAVIPVFFGHINDQWIFVSRVTGVLQEMHRKYKTLGKQINEYLVSLVRQNTVELYTSSLNKLTVLPSVLDGHLCDTVEVTQIHLPPMILFDQLGLDTRFVRDIIR